MAMESQPILDSTLPPSGLCNAVILARPYAPFICEYRSRRDVPSLRARPLTERLDGPSSVARRLQNFRPEQLGRAFCDSSVGTSANQCICKMARRADAEARSVATGAKSPGRGDGAQQIRFLLAPLVSVLLCTLYVRRWGLSSSSRDRHEDHLKLVHRTSSYSFEQPPSGSRSLSALLSGSQFVYHLWESFAHERYLSYYTPDLIHGEVPKGVDGEHEVALRELSESSFAREARRWVRDGFRERWRRAHRAGVVDR